MTGKLEEILNEIRKNPKREEGMKKCLEYKIHKFNFYFSDIFIFMEILTNFHPNISDLNNITKFSSN